MQLTDKGQFDAFMKLKKQIELIQYDQFKLDFEEPAHTDEFEPKELKKEYDEANVIIPVYIESYILTVLDLGDRVTITDILTASLDEFSPEIDKVRDWLKDDKHQRDLLYIYFGGAYTVEETTKQEPKYSLTIFSKEDDTQVVVKDTSTNKFKLAYEDIYYNIKENQGLVDKFTAEELTGLDLGQLLGENNADI